MKNKTPIKAAKKFIKHDLKYNVNYEALLLYLRKAGYLIIFYDALKGHSLITEFGMTQHCKIYNAFTAHKKDNKYVFIKKGLLEEEMLYALLHEAGHDVLEHLDSNRIPINKRLADMEAETFAYSVLHYKQANHLHIIYTLLALLVVCLVIIFQYPMKSAEPEPVHDLIPDNNTIVETVAVTQHGTKFHREDCMSIKGKNYILLPREEAEKMYEPCKICNP